MNFQPSSAIQDAEVYNELLRLGQLLAKTVSNALQIVYSAPEKPSDGDVVIADGTLWDPIGDSKKRPVWYDEDTGSWKKFDV